MLVWTMLHMTINMQHNQHPGGIINIRVSYENVTYEVLTKSWTYLGTSLLQHDIIQSGCPDYPLQPGGVATDKKWGGGGRKLPTPNINGLRHCNLPSAGHEAASAQATTLEPCK